MLVNLDRVLATDPSLHRALTQVLGWVTGQKEVNPLNLMSDDRRRLNAFVRREQDEARRIQREASTQPAPPPEPEKAVELPPPPPPPKQEEDPIFKEAMDPGEAAARKKVVDSEAAGHRLNEWAAAGLEDTAENAELIKNFVETSPVRGYWSREIVEAAVANLGPRGTNQLTWREAEPPPPAPPESEPSEVLADWQLRIDASEAEMKRADVRALKDLIKRRRAATNQLYIRRSGGFSSSF
jgi:hypothetical protein